ncbi:MAG: hypothetical protein AAGF11_35380 [Myxococcota bacterium]
MRRAGQVVLAAAIVVAGCGDEPQGREETGLEGLRLEAVQPRIIVPGSQIEISGQSFLDRPLGVSWLRLQGTYADGPIDAYLPAQFVDFEHMQIEAVPGVLALLGPTTGSFDGRAQVAIDFVPTGQRHASFPTAVTLELREHLTPTLDRIDAASEIFVNEPIEIHGAGLLLGGNEGTTYAVVEGCFSPAAGDGTCEPIVPVEILVRPAAPFDREHGIFAFSPRITGIAPGAFTGQVTLRNEHSDGERSVSGEQAVSYTLQPTRVIRIGDGNGDDEGDAVGTLGRYIPVHGGGFVSPEDGVGAGTVLRFLGTYTADEFPEPLPVDLELVPEVVDGRTVRYVVNEDDALAAAVDVRYSRGTFVGDVVPIVDFEGQALEGEPTAVTFELRPVRQVVYVQFNPTYVESLRLFGLRAADPQIRERVLAVLARDYEGVGVELRTEPPDDYALYATIEIAGPDPNGLGLLGYDNTPGKDTGNRRLNDRIGGVNAQTLEGGYPGFGGVFMESLFTFSLHPPADTVKSSDVATATFDEIFDPFRPDRGRPVTSEELAAGSPPMLDSAAACPGVDRATQRACAVFVLGSVVGSTVSHELGHSLGLADPTGERFHNTGDQPNRLMDPGAARSFEERAELMGQGPSRFCRGAYAYLREILPTDEPEPGIERPGC